MKRVALSGSMISTRRLVRAALNLFANSRIWTTRRRDRSSGPPGNWNRKQGTRELAGAGIALAEHVTTPEINVSQTNQMVRVSSVSIVGDLSTQPQSIEEVFSSSSAYPIVVQVRAVWFVAIPPFDEIANRLTASHVQKLRSDRPG